MNISTDAQGSTRQNVIRNLSEPLFNRLRDKLHNLRRKRASSDPVSLEAIRQRKFSLQNATTFQVGQPQFNTKFLKKGFSVDLGKSTDERAASVTPPPSGISVDEVEGHAVEGEAVVKRTSEEGLSASSPPEERERRDDTQSAADDTNSVGKKLNVPD